MADNGLGTYLATTEDVTVMLHIPLNAAEQVKQLLSPFVSLRNCDSKRPEGMWEIQCVSHAAHSGSSLNLTGALCEPKHEVALFEKTHKVTLSCEEPAFLPLAITRLATHLLRIESLNKGHCFFHGSAVSKHERSIILAGRKKSGKTTLAIEMMRNHNADFISNDNPSVKYINDTWHCIGWPRSIRIRQNMMYASGLLSDEVIGGPRRVTLSHPLSLGLTLPRAPNETMLDVTHIFPFELKALLQTNLRAKARLKAVVFLQSDNKIGEPKLERLSKSAASSFFEENTFPHIQLPGLEHAPYLYKLVTRNHKFHLAERLIEEVPCYTLNNCLNFINKSAAILEAKLLNN
ncbi:hypothetical protein [Salinicola sp. NYA28a]